MQSEGLLYIIQIHVFVNQVTGGSRGLDLSFQVIYNVFVFEHFKKFVSQLALCT